MKALVYLGPGSKRIEERPKPAIKAPGDAIVKISKTTICGTDLHILKGDVATCVPGRILGQEGTGVIDSVGAFSNLFRYWRRTTGRLQFAGAASPTKSPAPKESKESLLNLITLLTGGTHANVDNHAGNHASGR